MEKNKLMQMNSAELKQAYSDDLITADDLQEWVVRNKMKTGDYHDLSPKELRVAYGRGIVDKEQIERYRDKKKSPVLFHVKDYLLSVPRGVRNAFYNFGKDIKEQGDRLNESGAGYLAYKAQLLNLPAEYRPNLPTEEEWNKKAKALKERPFFDVEYEDLSHSETLIGGMAEGTSQFLTGFIPGMKLTKGFALKGLIKNSPKMLAFIESTIAGGLADGTVFDAHEGRLSDLIEEHPSLSNPITQYLKSHPDDTDAEGRLKNVLEGALAGGVMEALFMGLRGAKGRIWKKYHGVDEDVTRFIDEELIKEKRDMIQKTNEDIRNKEAGIEKADTQKKAVEKAKEGPEELNPVLEDMGVKKYDFTKEFKPEKITDVDDVELIKATDDWIRISQGRKEIDVPEGKGNYFNFDLVQSSDQVKMVLHRISELSGDVGRVSLKATKKLADSIGGTQEQMYQFIKDTYGSLEGVHAKIKAINDYLVSYDDFIMKISKEAQGTADFLRVLEHVKSFAEVQKMVKGIQVEMGRGLNSYKLGKEIRKFDYQKLGDDILDEISANTSEKRLKKMVKKYTETADRDARLKYARNMSRGRIIHGITEFYQANLVSSWVTHAVNTAGSGMATGWEGLVRTLACLPASVAQPWRMKQLGHMYLGYGQGFVDALRVPGLMTGLKGDIKGALKELKLDWSQGKNKQLGKVWQALIDGEPILDRNVKYDTPVQGGAIPGEFKNVFKKGVPWWARIPLGDLIRMPFRVLSAEDELFKAINYHAERNYRGFEAVYKANKGADGAVIKGQLDALLANNPEWLHTEALKTARTNTFTEQLGPLASGIGRLMAYDQRLGPLAYIPPLFKMLFSPFYNVGINLAKFSMRSSPFGILSPKNLEAIFKEGGIKAGEAVARITMGTVAMGAFMHLYDTGRIRGSAPSSQRSAWQNANIQEYSFITESGEEIAFNRLDPMAMTVGMACDIKRWYDAYQMDDTEFNELCSMALAVFSDNLTSKTYMESLAEFMDMIQGDNPKKIERWAKRTSANFLPGAIAMQTIQTTKDDTLRKQYSFLDGWYKWWDSKKMLPRRHNITGVPLERLQRKFGMLNRSQIDKDEDRAFLDMWRVGCNIEAMEESITLKGVKVELKPEQYDDLLSQLEKLPIKEILTKIYDDPEFKAIKDDEFKASFYSQKVAEFRESARKLYIAKKENRDVLDEVITELRDKASARIGDSVRQHRTTRLYKLNHIID